MEWDSPENFVIQYFVLARLLSYAYLIWSSWSDYVDFEPAHPGLHLVWTAVHTVTAVTLTCASSDRLESYMSALFVATVIVDNVLLLTVWLMLRRCRRVIEECVLRGEITGIHRSTYRYLDFIPPGDREEELSARHLLWESVVVFEDIKDVVAISGDGGNTEGESHAAAPSDTIAGNDARDGGASPCVLEMPNRGIPPRAVVAGGAPSGSASSTGAADAVAVDPSQDDGGAA